MEFADLQFNPTPKNGTQALAFFPNGYGVSVVRSDFSYGGKDGLYELAVLEGDKDDWKLCYDTSVTSDVLGHLTEQDVESYLNQTKSL